MVSYDNLFSEDFEKKSDRELLDFRKDQIRNLFNGQAGSQSNLERQALLDICDREIEMRFKKKAEERSNWALLISVTSLIIGIFAIIS